MWPSLGGWHGLSAERAAPSALRPCDGPPSPTAGDSARAACSHWGRVDQRTGADGRGAITPDGTCRSGIDRCGHRRRSANGDARRQTGGSPAPAPVIVIVIRVRSPMRADPAAIRPPIRAPSGTPRIDRSDTGTSGSVDRPSYSPTDPDRGGSVDRPSYSPTDPDRGGSVDRPSYSPNRS